MRRHRFCPDFLRRTLRLVALLGSIPALLLAPAAGATEVKTFYAACDSSDETAVRLEPSGTDRTTIIDARANPPALVATLPFPTTVDHIATHLTEIREALRRGGTLDCADAIRVHAHVRTVAYPRPANLSPALDSAAARREEHWMHAEVRELQERGQGTVVTADDTRYTDPDWPLYAVGMVLFFSAGNGGEKDVSVIYTWNHETHRYDRVAEAEDITPWTADEPATHERILSYMGANLRFPATIPAGEGTPELTLMMNRATFYKAQDSGVGQCSAPTGSHEEIEACVEAGNAVLLASSAAQTWNKRWVHPRVMGAVTLSGNYFGEVLIYAPDQDRYVGVPALRGTQASLCRTCFRHPVTQAALRAAMQPNFASPAPAVDTSATTATSALIATETASVPAATQQPEGYREVWSWRAEWRGLRWYGQALVVIAALVLLLLLWFVVAYMRAQWKIGRQRRRLAKARNLEASVDELFRMTEEKRREVERMIKNMQP